MHARPWMAGRALGVGGSVVANPDLRPQPNQRVVLLVHDSFLHGNDGVVGDLDVLGADLSGALGDVAQADPLLVPGEHGTIWVAVQRVHGELGCPDQEPRPREGLLVVVVIANHVTDVLAKEALDALAELLRPLDVQLLHPVVARRHTLGRREGRDLAGLLVVEGDVRDQVPNDREGAHRRHRDGLLRDEGVHPGHAQQAGLAVDLGAAGPALAGIAVPAHREVRHLRRLQPVDDVEQHLTFVDLNGVVLQITAVGVTSPDLELRLVAHAFSPEVADGVCGLSRTASSGAVMYFSSSWRSNSANRSGRMVGTGLWESSMSSVPGVRRQTRFTPRQLGSIVGKSSRVCPPRLS